MMPRFLTILTGRNLPKIVQQRQAAQQLPVNEGAVAHFARVLEKMGILKPKPDESDPTVPPPQQDRSAGAFTSGPPGFAKATLRASACFRRPFQSFDQTEPAGPLADRRRAFCKALLERLVLPSTRARNRLRAGRLVQAAPRLDW